MRPHYLVGMTFASVGTVASSVLLLGLMPACSPDTPIKGSSVPTKPAASASPTDAGGVGTLGGTDPSAAGASAQPESLSDILKQCGVDTASINDPAHVVYDSTITSWPKVYVGAKFIPLIGNVNYRVTVKTKLTVHSTIGQTVKTTDFDITAEPQSAMAEAQKTAAPNRGIETDTIMQMKDRITILAPTADWAGVVCTLQPATDMEIDKGTYSKHLRFTPALPVSLSPIADPARYKAEIGSGRTFSNITVEVITSTDPALPSGTKLTGSVSVTKVAPQLTLNIGGQSQQTVTADDAYEFVWNFGSGVADTTRLGLFPKEQFFLDQTKKDFKIIVADTGNADTGTVVLAEGL